MGGQAPTYQQVAGGGPSAQAGDYNVDWMGSVNGPNGPVAKSPLQDTMDPWHGDFSTGQFDLPGQATNRLSHSSEVTGNSPASGGSGSPIPSLGDVAKQPSPFQTWLDPTNPGGLSKDSTFNPSTLSSDFLGKDAMDGGGHVNTGALNALQSYAVNPNGGLNTADSPWLTLQKQNIDTMTGQARDQASLDAQAAGSGAMSNAAMHGGITGGGAARIGAVSDMSGATGMQRATTAGNLAKNDAGMQDWTNKIGVAGAIPGMQLGLGQYNSNLGEFNANTTNAGKEFNIGNLIGGMTTGNNNLLAQYAQSIAGQGGSEMADAMRHSGKKKG